MVVAKVDRPQNIQTLIDSVERYNPENVPVLEDYLSQQCSNDTYDLEANLALLKLYQFNLSSAKESVIVNILSKALTAIPGPDFNLCMYLLADFAASENVQQLIQFQQLLEQARYAEFWKVYASHKELVKAVNGFEDAIRAVIAKVVSMSYQSINKSVLESYFALDGKAFEDFCAKHQWQINGNVVTIPVNKDNEAKSVEVRENIKFEQLTKVIGYSNEM